MMDILKMFPSSIREATKLQNYHHLIETIRPFDNDLAHDFHTASTAQSLLRMFHVARPIALRDISRR